ncbi:MAG: ferritin-like domain-containing protein [Hymenobacteraceae bacterium]|nr:ferritin-like domain-containing protein [Hymenobacteraceae bacterium]
MNLFQIFDSISKVDDAALDRFDTRRAVFGHMFSTGKKITAAAAPVFLASLFNKAYAGETGVRETVNQVLAYALRLERLEYQFYKQGLESTSIALSGDDRAGLQEIRDNEASHVALLESVLPAAQQPALDNHRFNKVYTEVFNDRATFLAVAQALEDTGVRAYKGRAAELLGTDTLTVALNIHSVEARHASHIRRLRGEKAWIEEANSTIPNVPLPAPAMGTVAGNAFYQAGSPAADYPSEANTAQGGLTGLYAGNGIPASRYSEAFDEPLDKNTVLDTVSLLFL